MCNAPYGNKIIIAFMGVKMRKEIFSQCPCLLNSASAASQHSGFFHPFLPGRISRKQARGVDPAGHSVMGKKHRQDFFQ